VGQWEKVCVRAIVGTKKIGDLRLVMIQRGIALEGMNCADGVWQVAKKAGMRGMGMYECVRGRAWLVGKLRG
jgi:hypothetical protein